jgi:hypothetical protein
VRRGRQTYERVQVHGTRSVVSAARRQGVKRVLLVSFLRARPSCGSPYHESKWAAEEIVRSSGLECLVVKAAMMYGRGNHRLQHPGLIADRLHVLPLVGLRHRPIRPNSIDDAVRILRAFLIEGRLSGRTVPILGPEEMLLAEAAQRVAQMNLLPGQENRLPRPIFLPLINDGIEVPLAPLGPDTAEVLEDREYVMPTEAGLAPVRLKIPRGTVITFPPGVERKLSVTRVPLNRVPMVLQDGLFSRMYVSIQPEGATFDPPLPISFPNVDGAAPGETVRLMSFVHDLGRFAEVGSARVSADGRTVETEPGVGIREADWHATPRAPSALVTTVCGTTALPMGVDPNEIECDCWCGAQPAAPMGGGVVCAANVPVSAATLSEFWFDEGAAAAAQELQRRGGAASLECVCREKDSVKLDAEATNQDDPTSTLFAVLPAGSPIYSIPPTERRLRRRCCQAAIEAQTSSAIGKTC